MQFLKICIKERNGDVNGLIIFTNPYQKNRESHSKFATVIF